MSLKIHALVKGVATLGNGKELRVTDGYRYTVVRGGLRIERASFEQLKIGDTVLCWEGADGKAAKTT